MLRIDFLVKKYLPFIGILIVAFTAFLDYMLINNALPKIQEVFEVPILTLQWLANVYSIILAATLILFGRLGDMFINIPVLIVGTSICVPFVRGLGERLHRVSLDGMGNVLLLVSLASLIYGLIHQQQVGFDPSTIGCFILFGVSTVLLIYVETHQEHPSVNFSFFKKPDFILAVLLNAMAGAFVSCGMFFSLSVYGIVLFLIGLKTYKLKVG